MGRKRKPEKERKKPVSVSLSEEEVQKIREVCNQNLSDCIRKAINEYLKKRG